MACLLSLTAVDESSLPTSEVHFNMYGGSADGMSHWSKCLVLLIEKNTISFTKVTKKLVFALFCRLCCTDLVKILFPDQPSYLGWDGFKYLSTYKIKLDITVEPRVRVTSLSRLLSRRNTYRSSDTKTLEMQQILFNIKASAVKCTSILSIDTLHRHLNSRSVLDWHPDRYSVDTWPTVGP